MSLIPEAEQLLMVRLVPLAVTLCNILNAARDTQTRGDHDC